MKKYIYSYLFMLLVLTSCEREQQPDHPIVFTGDITDITTNGASYHGKIVVSQPGNVIDHGFVFFERFEDDIDKPCYHISLGPMNSPDFSVTTLTPFVKNRKYFVRAYAKVGISSFYGMERNYISLAEGYPEIERIEPPVATWGDTITIHGKYFSHENGNYVTFGNYHVKVLSARANMLKVRVPDNLLDVNPGITVSVMGKKANAPFRLSPPVIRGFSPEQGIPGTHVTIRGKYFRKNETRVMFGNTYAYWIEYSDTLIKVAAPLREPPGPVSVSVYVLNQVTTAQTPFIYLP
jgi:hypothetical protein